MNLSVVEIIKLGQQYVNFWPERPELTQYFVDYKSVQSARFVCRYFPALALFTVIMQIYLGSGYPFGQGSVGAAVDALSQALVYGLFILSIPIQGLVILGVKADKLLPPSLASWYRSGLEKAKEQDKKSKLAKLAKMAVAKPRYIDLAQLLHITYSARK